MYVHRYAKYNHFSIGFAIFTKALRTNQRTNQRTDRQTDRRTDIPSYRDAIAASKKWDHGQPPHMQFYEYHWRIFLEGYFYASF